jgi:hypothetical protein
MVEVARCLGVFPSKCEQVLKILKDLHPKSPHLAFTVHLLKKRLRALLSNHLARFIDFRDHFVKHHHQFWEARRERRWVASLVDCPLLLRRPARDPQPAV